MLRTFESSLGSSRMPPHFYPLRTNRSVRFGFSGSTVLLASRGYPVSCYTTEGGATHSSKKIALLWCSSITKLSYKGSIHKLASTFTLELSEIWTINKAIYYGLSTSTLCDMVSKIPWCWSWKKKWLNCNWGKANLSFLDLCFWNLTTADSQYFWTKFGV